MWTVIAEYTTGGNTYVVRKDKFGNIERNGCPVRENRNGRRWVLTHNRKKRYLCCVESCFKNARIGPHCRDHSPEYQEPEKPLPPPTDPWDSVKRGSSPAVPTAALPNCAGASSWEDIADGNSWW